jgi:hypothetical protein
MDIVVSAIEAIPYEAGMENLVVHINKLHFV